MCGGISYGGADAVEGCKSCYGSDGGRMVGISIIYQVTMGLGD